MFAPEPGTVLAGRFRIERRLGQGGMGAVYLATDLSLKRPVALKMLVPGVLDDPDTLSRFATEARAIGALGHPHIAVLLDFHAAHDPAPFLVLEYIEGQSLHALLRSEPRLSVPRAVGLARQVLSALGAVHAIGTVHRDIKPANIMLVPGGATGDFARLVDFGIARVADHVTRSHRTSDGAILGTPQYMAPEQAAGLPALAAVDLYAVGVCLFEMLAGYNPFAVGPPVLVFAAVRDVVPPMLDTVRPDVPRALALVVARALAKLPSSRFASAREFDEALAASLGLGVASTIRENAAPSGSSRSLPPGPPGSSPSLPPTVGTAHVPPIAPAAYVLPRGPGSSPSLAPTPPAQTPQPVPSTVAYRTPAWVGAVVGALAVITLLALAAAGAVFFLWRATPALDKPASVASGATPASAAPAQALPPVVAGTSTASAITAPGSTMPAGRAPAGARASGSATPAPTAPSPSAPKGNCTCQPLANTTAPSRFDALCEERLLACHCGVEPGNHHCLSPYKSCGRALSDGGVEPACAPGATWAGQICTDNSDKEDVIYPGMKPGGACTGFDADTRGGKLRNETMAGQWRCSYCSRSATLRTAPHGSPCTGFNAIDGKSYPGIIDCR